MKQKEVGNMRLSGLLLVLAFVLLVSCTPQLPQSERRGYVGGAIAPPATNLPDWAQSNSAPWASLPSGILLDGKYNSNGEFTQGTEVEVDVSNADLVWSEGYYTDANYILSELKNDPSGQTINPEKVWVKFNLEDGGVPVSNPSWIQTSGKSATARVPTASFAQTQALGTLSQESLNAILVFACTQSSILTTGTVVYDCRGADNLPVMVRSDGTLEQLSGRGSWMLSLIEVVPPVVSSASVPPFQPGSLGSSNPTTPAPTVPPFQPGGLGSSSPTSGTGSTGTGSMGTSTTGIVPPLGNTPPPQFCITPNNPPGCI